MASENLPSNQETGSAFRGRWRCERARNAEQQPGCPLLLIVARNRFDGGNHLLVGHFVGGADKAGVAPVHEQDSVAFRVAAQRGDQLPPLGVVEGTEIHTILLPSTKSNGCTNKPISLWLP